MDQPNDGRCALNPDLGPPSAIPPRVLRLARRAAIPDPKTAAGQCERVSDALRFRLLDLGYRVDVVAGWYNPASPPERWANTWHVCADEAPAIDHAWIRIHDLRIYVDPTIAQFADGEHGVQIAQFGDPRYLLVHPRTGTKARLYHRLD